MNIPAMLAFAAFLWLLGIAIRRGDTPRGWFR